MGSAHSWGRQGILSKSQEALQQREGRAVQIARSNLPLPESGRGRFFLRFAPAPNLEDEELAGAWNAPAGARQQGPCTQVRGAGGVGTAGEIPRQVNR